MEYLESFLSYTKDTALISGYWGIMIAVYLSTILGSAAVILGYYSEKSLLMKILIITASSFLMLLFGLQFIGFAIILIPLLLIGHFWAKWNNRQEEQREKEMIERLGINKKKNRNYGPF